MRSVFLVLVAVLALPGEAWPQSLKEHATFEAHKAISSISLSPDGRWLAVVSGNQFVPNEPPKPVAEPISIWDVAKRAKVGDYSVPEEKNDPRFPRLPPGWPNIFRGRVAIASDGRTLAVPGDGIGFRIMTLPEKGNTLVPKTEPLQLSSADSPVFSRDGTRVAVGGGTVSTQLGTWNPAPKRLAGYGFSHSPDLKLLAASSYQDVDLFDAETGDERAALLDHRGSVNAVAFNADSSRLAVASCRSDSRLRKMTLSIAIWNLASAKGEMTKPEKLFDDVPGMPFAIGFSADGEALFVSARRLLDDPTRFLVFNARTGKLAHEIDFEMVKKSPAFIVHSGDTVAGAFRDGKVRLWQIAK